MPYVHEGPSRLWLTESGDVVEDGDERASDPAGCTSEQTLSDEEPRATSCRARPRRLSTRKQTRPKG